MHPLQHETEWIDPVTGYAVPKQLGANLAHRRDILIACDGKPERRDDYLDLCRQSVLLWVNLFVWTLNVKAVSDDGREMPAAEQHMPFITWPVQDDAVLTLQECIACGDDAVVDKSRDMGASWLTVAVAHYHWLFEPNSHVLLTSRVEDLVDKKGDPDSLFWKLDYINQNLPDWMLPGEPIEFQRGGMHRSHMHLENPKLGCTIDGQATTAHIGRGGRRKFVVFDEMAAMEGATAAWQSASDTTSCKIGNSTPIGPGTEFTKQRNRGVMSGSPRVITLGYWDHPDKGRGRQWRTDEDGSITGIAGRGYWHTPWFEQQLKRRDRADVGQNILIDHTTSGQLFFNSAVVTGHAEAFGAEPVRCELTDERFVPDRHGRWYCWFDLTEHKGQASIGTNYVLFADPSYGKGAANGVIAAMDVETGELLAEFVDPYATPNELAKEMCDTGSTVFQGQVGHAVIGWETNGPGEAIYRDVLDYGYPFVYYRRQIGVRGDRATQQYGWMSGRREKRVLLGNLDRALTRSEIKIPSRDGLKEMLEYVFFDDGSIGPGHMRDETTGARMAHGDRAIAYGGVVMLRVEAPQFIPPEERYRPEQMGAIAEHYLLEEDLDAPERQWWQSPYEREQEAALRFW